MRLFDACITDAVHTSVTCTDTSCICVADPRTTTKAPKAMDLIATNLQAQYQRWQPKAR